MRKLKFTLFLLFFFFLILCVKVSAQSGISSDNILLGLSPESVWNYFYEITKIPRCSGEENKVRDWVVETTKSLGLNSVVDEAGNVKVEKAATSGYESHEGVVLQAHLDMVCSPMNMEFPLLLKINDGWVTANNTTLGADNGIGLAIAMAVLSDENISHPPLEVLFTVDEETGLTGAKNLKPDFLRFRKLINLDSEQEGEITIGCAGGGRSNIEMTFKREDIISDLQGAVVSVNGLLGGHSGIDVDKRLNPNKLIAEFLQEANQKIPELRLVSIKSGEQDNVIPSKSDAWILIDDNNIEVLNNIKSNMLRSWREKYIDIEPSINIDIYKVNAYKPIPKESTNKIINMLNELPYGVIAWSKEIEDTIETSVNISPIKTFENSLSITMMSRSAKLEERDTLRALIKDIANKYGAECVEDEGYAPWEPNFDSPLLALAVDVYKNLYNIEPKIVVTHGGLETAVIGATYDGMDMISIGPTIENAHSPQERLNIESVDHVYTYLLELLKSL